jgi:hypothetical protein
MLGWLAMIPWYIMITVYMIIPQYNKSLVSDFNKSNERVANEWSQCLNR